MRRYTIRINETEHVIDVDELSATQFDVVVDGIPTRVELTDHADIAQAVITPDVTPGGRPLPSAPAVTSPVVRDLPQGELGGAPVPSAAAHKPAPAVAAGPATAGADAMTAPMPGVVLEIVGSPGLAVQRGDLVMVLEAMKMKNEIRATRDGTIARIPVAVGDQVRFGDVLVEFGQQA